MPLTEASLEIHAKNPRYGMPLCWNPRAEITTFEASWYEDEVNCKHCLLIMKE